MELDDYLDSVGCNLYICRGNHDDPLFWNKNVEYKRIFLQPDFSVRFIEDKKYFLLVVQYLLIEKEESLLMVKNFQEYMRIK